MDAAVIVAGGQGKRMGASVPKQFLELRDKPILLHTLQAFHAYRTDLKLIVVLPATHIEHWKGLISGLKVPDHQIVEGGKERFDSVRNGLQEVPDDGVVGVHDGVRCLITSRLIGHCFETAREKGSAVPCMPARESLRWEEADGSNRPLDRHHVRIVQTPQCFRSSELKNAFQQEYDPAFTDEATVMEAAGYSVHLTHGAEGNIKITSPEDLGWADRREEF